MILVFLTTAPYPITRHGYSLFDEQSDPGRHPDQTLRCRQTKACRPAGRDKALCDSAEPLRRRTAEAATDAGALVAIVTADAGVAAWARGLGYLVIDETLSRQNRSRRGRRLRGDRGCAATAALGSDPRRPPAGDARRARSASSMLSTVATVLVPSYNGGTNIVAGNGAGFRFAYGPGSFHRHLAHERTGIGVRPHPQLALDLDTTRGSGSGAAATHGALAAAAWFGSLRP